MRKILPKIYKGSSIIPNKNQVKTLLSSSISEIKNVVSEEDINSKIKNIFQSPKYVYKANVRIILKDGLELKKTIIGRTNNSLITIDDELINVNNISEINFLD